MRGGLTRRTVVASAVLALVVGAAFGILVNAIGEQRDSAALATRAQEAITAADRLERLVLDLETGQRGYLVTREPRFLTPWRAARADYRRAGEQLVTASNGAAGPAREIVTSVEDYVRNYSVPLVMAARRGDASARSPAALDEGRRRVDTIRRRFDAFEEIERRSFAVREARADADAHRAIVVGTVGLIGSIVLIVLFGGYLTRAVALPVRRAASMAGRLAGGDLATRMPETSGGEVGTLERSFNTMAGSLEASQDELRVLADEQAALRRVATLVARGVPAAELFDAVAGEVHRLLGADFTVLIRAEGADEAVIVADRADQALRDRGRIPLEDGTVTAKVLRTGRPARMDNYGKEAGPLADRIRAEGVHASAGAPIVVDGRLWGLIVVSWRRDEPALPQTESRLTQFTELVATAIANAQSREELAASRARVVATADETRRRLERDLHDGAQQSLVHAVIDLKLALRELDDSDATANRVQEALEHAERANTELRDLAHGILPAALTRAGLKSGVGTLLSRIRLPVSAEVTAERLPAGLEATAYFIVAEALTNTVKHARASRAEVKAVVQDGALVIEVRDDGVGGADENGSAGLLGLRDRAAAVDGELRIESPRGGGTTVTARLPIPS